MIIKKGVISIGSIFKNNNRCTVHINPIQESIRLLTKNNDVFITADDKNFILKEN